MTDEEAEETSLIYLTGFASGREFERKLIVALLLEHGKRQIAQAIESGAHLK